MGVRLLEIYGEAKLIGGIHGAVQLAIITKLSTAAAGQAPDSPENIELFEHALSKITGQNGAGQ